MYSGLNVIRCGSVSGKITYWPKATRAIEISKTNFTLNEHLYVNISCMNKTLGEIDLKILYFYFGSLWNIYTWTKWPPFVCDIFQFSWMTSFVFWLKLHWSLLLKVQSIISKHLFMIMSQCRTVDKSFSEPKWHSLAYWLYAALRLNKILNWNGFQNAL